MLAYFHLTSAQSKAENGVYFLVLSQISSVPPVVNRLS